MMNAQYVGTGDARGLSSHDLASLGIDHDDIFADKRVNDGIIVVSNKLGAALEKHLAGEWKVTPIEDIESDGNDTKEPVAFADDTHVSGDTTTGLPESEESPAAAKVAGDAKKK